MGETIWKFPLMMEDYPVVTMPRGAEVLCVQLQHGMPTLWARVDPQKAKEDRALLIVGTGNPMPDGAGRYVGTFQHGPFVWHVFEESNDA